ncbi:MAG: hypothetical protein AAFX41_15535 [Bacteroidota bacterium]
MNEAILTTSEVRAVVEQELETLSISPDSVAITAQGQASSIDLCDALPVAIEVLKALIDQIKNPFLKMAAKIVLELLEEYLEKLCS